MKGPAPNPTCTSTGSCAGPITTWAAMCRQERQEVYNFLSVKGGENAVSAENKTAAERLLLMSTFAYSPTLLSTAVQATPDPGTVTTKVTMVPCWQVPSATTGEEDTSSPVS